MGPVRSCQPAGEKGDPRSCLLTWGDFRVGAVATSSAIATAALP